MTPLAYGDDRHLRAHQFLVEEAHLLDSACFGEWLTLLHPSIRYRMPVRVTASKATPEQTVQTMDHFDEDLYSLRKRVERLGTDHAWAEDPPSRTRRHVSNVRTFVDADVPVSTATSGDAAAALRVESSVLLYRSRGDRTEATILSAGRSDRLVDVAGELRLRERLIMVDEAVLRMQNLAIFL
jgi:phthalate 3,4-dioxygenase subunit beta